MLIYVTSLAGLESAISKVGPSHLISLLQPKMMIGTPRGVVPAQHLKVGIDDIAHPVPGATAPQPHHVQEIIDFVETWPREQPLLIHCHMGISRSTAAAFTALCAIRGPGHEENIAFDMRRRGRHVQPNRLIVRHADELLDRGGRMLSAVEAIGSGMFDNVPNLLELPLDPSATDFEE